MCVCDCSCVSVSVCSFALVCVCLCTARQADDVFFLAAGFVDFACFLQGLPTIPKLLSFESKYSSQTKNCKKQFIIVFTFLCVFEVLFLQK